MPIIKKNLTNTNYESGNWGIQWIVIHNVGTAPQWEGAAYNNTVYFKDAYRGASAHFFIDEGDVIWQCVDTWNTAWAVGDNTSRNGCTNYNSISIEVCGDWEFNEAEISNLTWLVQKLMGEYGIDADHVIRHYDVTWKNCPAYYTDEDNWYYLHQRVTEGSSSRWVWSDWASKYWYRYSDGTYPADEWEQINGYWYHFDTNGYMETGWIKPYDTWYYLTSSGEALINQWSNINDNWYYFDESGAMYANGFHKINGYWFYFDTDGHMQTGWVIDNDKYYWLDSQGYMASSKWLYIDDNYYYVNGSGEMLVGLQEINGATYYLNENHDGTYGAMQTGLVEIEGEKYFFDRSGAKVVSSCQFIDGAWYGFDGQGRLIDENIQVKPTGEMLLTGDPTH